MNTKIIQRIMLALVSVSLFTTNDTVMAISKKVTASNAYVKCHQITKSEAKNHKYWREDYYTAKGYGSITSEDYHYTSVVLYLMGGSEATSGRKWGTGCVSAHTGYGASCCLFPELWSASVYYGF